MKLEDIINIAIEAYPDADALARAWDATGHGEYQITDLGRAGVGDTLAVYIVNELIENYVPGVSTLAQMSEAVRVMRTALGDIRAVFEALNAYRHAEADR